MSTLGHPLSDLANLLQPYLLSSTPIAKGIGRAHPAFSPEKENSARPSGLPSASQCLEWYCEIAGWDPTPDLAWGEAFGMFRNSVIMQGIKARYALRQASSAQAKEVGSHMQPLGEFTWELVERLQGRGGGREERDQQSQQEQGQQPRMTKL